MTMMSREKFGKMIVDERRKYFIKLIVTHFHFTSFFRRIFTFLTKR